MGKYVQGLLVKSRQKLQKANTKPPTLPKRVSSYIQERLAWLKKGKPVRPQQEIEYIFNKFCKPCKYYNGKLCSICGCYVNDGNTLNKILWATTRCPDNPPKWIEYNEKKDLPQKKPKKKRKRGRCCKK